MLMPSSTTRIGGWKLVKINRISKITKAEIVGFANKFFGNNFACVYKEQGNDTTIKKVEKPSITPIPTNNDKHSAFLEEIVNAKTTPIQPHFVDYQRDLTKSTTRKGLPVLYKQDTSMISLRCVLFSHSVQRTLQNSAMQLDILII